MDNRERLVEKISRSQEQTLEPLERHRLTAFYEDGGEHMKGAMQLREILARQRKEIQAMLRAVADSVSAALRITRNWPSNLYTAPHAD